MDNADGTTTDGTSSTNSNTRNDPDEAEVLLSHRSQPVAPSKEKGAQPHKARAKESREQGIEGTVRTLVIAISVLVLPLSIIVALLLYILIVYNVKDRVPSSSSPQLRLDADTDDSSALLVNFSATRLTTFASWASNTATLLPGFLMTLCSFPLAKRFMRQSERSVIGRELPTPYQLGLLLKTLDAQISSLWEGYSYLLWKRRDKLTTPLRTAFIVLTAGSILGYSIWAADTWLHVSTSTVAISKITPVHPPQNAYGFGLPKPCDGIYNNVVNPDAIVLPGCDFDSGNMSTPGLGATQDGYKTINNISTSHQVLTSTINGTEFSFLAPARLDRNLDFTTSTIAVSTSCTPISKKCHLNANYQFNCSDTFNGVFGEQLYSAKFPSFCEDDASGCVAYFTDKGLNDSISRDRPARNSYGQYINPWYIGVAGMAASANSVNAALLTDPEIAVVTSNLIYFMLGCQVNTSNLRYSYVNGSVVSSATELVLADDDVAYMSQSFAGDGVELPQLGYSIQVATVLSASAQELADNYAHIFSQIVLAYTATGWVPRQNTQEQTRQSLLVARVPKAPLVLFVLLCLLYVGTGIVLGAVVVCCSEPVKARDVQARLSIIGVIASCFEARGSAGKRVLQLEDMFEERRGQGRSARVAMIRDDDGGWVYKTVGKDMGDG